MTNTELKKILNKTSWTGEELGKLEIKIFADIYQKEKQGLKATPLIPLDQLQSMIHSITSKEEGAIFNGYHAIYNWIYQAKTAAEAMQQQAVLRFQMLEKYFRTSIMAEDAYRYASSLPLILTQAQYDNYKKAKIEKLTKDKENGLPFMFLRAINYYTEQIEKNPKAKNPLSPLKKKYSQEKITSSYIKHTYNRSTGGGYWQLEDGRRSDQMSREEWIKAYNPELYSSLEYMESHNGELSSEAKERKYRRWLDRNLFLLKGLPEILADRYHQEEDIKAGRTMEVTWHYYKDLPENLTKWDILVNTHTLWDCYSRAFSETVDQKEYLAELQDFLEEYKDLAAVLIQDINKVCLPLVRLKENQKPIASMEDIPIASWRDYRVSLEDLYSKNIYGTKDCFDDPKNLFIDNKKAVNNGVAIVDRADYKEPKIEPSFKEKTLEGFFTDSPDYAFNVDTVKTSRLLLIQSYYYVKGFNKLLEIIADYYHVQDVNLFRCTMQENIEKFIGIHNELIPTLYGAIYDNYYTDESFKNKKLQALKDNFSLINIEGLEPSEDTLKEVKKAFKDFKAFRGGLSTSSNADWLTLKMCYLPEDYYRGL